MTFEEWFAENARKLPYSETGYNVPESAARAIWEAAIQFGGPPAPKRSVPFIPPEAAFAQAPEWEASIAAGVSVWLNPRSFVDWDLIIDIFNAMLKNAPQRGRLYSVPLIPPSDSKPYARDWEWEAALMEATRIWNRSGSVGDRRKLISVFNAMLADAPRENGVAP
jgi:hypothetical protein